MRLSFEREGGREREENSKFEKIETLLRGSYLEVVLPVLSKF